MVVQVKGLDSTIDDGTFLRSREDAGVLLLRTDHGWYAYLAIKIGGASPRLEQLMDEKTRAGWLVPLSQMPRALRRDPEVATLHLHAASGMLSFSPVVISVLT